MQDIDFVLAKIHGIHSKSVVGDNYERLRKIDSIDSLNKELFGGDKIGGASKRLYTDIEKKFKIKVYKEITELSKYFDYKNVFINNTILKYEIENVKNLVNAHILKIKTDIELFEVKLENTLNYDMVNKLDYTDFANLKKILEPTIFNFVINLVENKNDKYFIENELDKFYYRKLVESTSRLSKTERDKLKPIILEEMNWQNIVWALRTKLYYNKIFSDVEQSFLTESGLIPKAKISKIFDLEFIRDEQDKILSGFPTIYRELIKSATSEEGDIDIPKLEIDVDYRLYSLYIKNFYLEFNILAIIAFIHIKMKEYNNVVKIVESIRYKTSL
ncbi:MAG TPA: V-type ATPase subunit [Spirochaetota bacterium]|jgi:hypothetical protein|nr:V-type ATPase subunit [Spirochaetota bacterium]HPY87676.1 V-type ATPase subunit [Spirochaetota bacterium]HQB60162.1 V-type ATPase subunit [Spirochaetota bacterium]